MPVALIIGGGIAGPATALAVQRRGWQPHIFEAYPRPDRDVGSYFSITPNGLHVLQDLDALSLLQPRGLPTTANVLWNERGQRLGRVGLGQPENDTAALTFKRAHVARVLRDEACRRGVPVTHDKRLVDTSHTPDGRVVAHFADGSEAVGDLLVAADGIQSRTRQLIDPAAPRGRFVGLTNFGGVTHDVRLAAEPHVWHMIFGRHAFFGYLLDGQGDAVWFVNVPRAEITPEERAATSADDWRRQLVALCADDAGPGAALIERGELELAGDNTYDLPHVPVWYRARQLLIGDAAHAPSPSSGQGASLALEDALVLARCLGDTAAVDEACAAFERARRARVERIVAEGARSSSTKVPGPFGRLVRDQMLRVLLRFVITDRAQAWITGYRA